MKYLVQLSDWCGSVFDWETFSSKSKAVAWVRERNNGNATVHAHLWDYENQTLLKEWKLRGGNL